MHNIVPSHSKWQLHVKLFPFNIHKNLSNQHYIVKNEKRMDAIKSAMSSEPNTKRAKSNKSDATQTCQFFVKRKKRNCRMIAARDEEYCGEHLPITKATFHGDNLLNTDAANDNNFVRIPCPLDPKHTVFAAKLEKHLKICNAAVRDQPDYIVPGLNSGKSEENTKYEDFKLTDIDTETTDRLIEKIEHLYSFHKIDAKIVDLIKTHPVLEAELSNDEYGCDTKKHLLQTSAILGYLTHYEQFEEDVSFVEYGAGKGQVSYWLAKCLESYRNTNVLLIDRACLRHKKDNKLDDSYAVKRVRADIADFDISKYDLVQKSKKIVAIGKHLCGAATDFAIQCSLHGNNVAQQNGNGPTTNTIIIALCCHHRCDWVHFIGKEFFIQNNFSVKEFMIITKMVGWATCGTGFSRERRKQIAEQKSNTFCNQKMLSYSRRKEIGDKCKRLLDFARICYLEKNGYKCSLKRYVSSDITLENICLVAFLNKKLPNT